MSATEKEQADEALAGLLQKLNDQGVQVETVDELDCLEVEELAKLLASQHCLNLLEQMADIDQLSESGRLGVPCRTPKVSEMFGRYRLSRELGKGGFSRVYLAEDEELGRQVALKIPLAWALQSPAAQKRFVREAKAAGQLDHPGIVAVFEAGFVEETPFIVFAFCDGPTLSQWMESRWGDSTQRSPDDNRAIVSIIYQLADAVAHAHQKGVLHRDLKPGNVLIKQSESVPEILVADFGTAKQLSDLQEPTVTQEGFLVGTPAYMSPEQSLGLELGTRSDLYSIGVILYELLCGRTPFGRSNTAATLRAVQTEDVPVQALKHVDRDLSAICLKCLRRNPEDRYQSVHRLREDLQAWLDGRIVSARHATPWERSQRWVANNPTAVSTVSFVLLVFIMASVTLASLWQLSEDQRRTAELRVLEAKQHAAELEVRTQQALDAQLEASYQQENAELEKDAANRTLSVFLSAIDQMNPNPRGHKPLTAVEFLKSVQYLVAQDLSDDPRSESAVLLSLGRAFSAIGYYDDALSCQVTALSIFQQEFGADDQRTLGATRQLAATLEKQGKLKQAVALQEQALEQGKRPNSLQKYALNRLAQNYLELGDTEKALKLLEPIVKSLRPQSVVGNPRVSSVPAFLPAKLTYIKALRDKGDLEGAIESAKQEWEERVRKFGTEEMQTLRAMSLYAEMLFAMKGQHREQALGLLTELTGITGRKVPDTIFHFQQLATLADWYSLQDQHDRALPLLHGMIEDLQQRFGVTHPLTMDTAVQLSVVCRRAGTAEYAVDPLSQIHGVCLEQFGTMTHPRVYAITRELARSYFLGGDEQKAKQLLLECLAERQQGDLINGGRQELELLEDLTYCLVSCGEPDLCEQVLQRRLTILENQFGFQHNVTQRVAALNVRVLLIQSKFEDANTLLECGYLNPHRLGEVIPDLRGLAVLTSALQEQSLRKSGKATWRFIPPERQAIAKHLLSDDTASNFWRAVILTLTPESLGRAKPDQFSEVASGSFGFIANFKKTLPSPVDRRLLQMVEDYFRETWAEPGVKSAAEVAIPVEGGTPNQPSAF